MDAGVNRPRHEADHSPSYRAGLINILCGGKLGQNLVCIRATWNSVHGLQIEYGMRVIIGGSVTCVGLCVCVCNVR